MQTLALPSPTISITWTALAISITHRSVEASAIQGSEVVNCFVQHWKIDPLAYLATTAIVALDSLIAASVWGLLFG